MIRDAQLFDLPKIVEMGVRFRKDTTYEKYLRENPERMAELATKLIESKSLLVSEKDGQLTGMLGFLTYSHFISGDIVTGEIFWWVEPEVRGEGLKLLREMERRASLAGSKHVQMIAPNVKTEHLYKRLGYEFVEATYQRTL